MIRWRYSVVRSIGLASCLVLMPAVAKPPATLAQANEPVSSQTIEAMLASLPDGAYQFCTEPAPSDWTDGAGACLNFLKQGTFIDGYYGYPHSESFVCLHGQVSENWLHGDGFVIAWAGHPWTDIPQSQFMWDKEDRLSLSEGALARSEGDMSWITFQQADLDMQALYQYSAPRMNAPDQLCEWSLS